VGSTEGYTSGCLRDVPNPRETESECEGPAVWIILEGVILKLQEEMPVVSLVILIKI